jgi:protein maelstrom
LFAALFIPVSFPIFLIGYFFLNLGAGYIYGNFHGFLITSGGTAVGTTLSFFVLRYLCKDYLSRLAAKNKDTMGRIMKVVNGGNGWKIMMMTRLSPVPMGVQNALFAATDLDANTILVGTFFALMPTQILNTYMGSQLHNLEDVLAGKAEGKEIVLYLQLTIALGVSWYVNQNMKKEIEAECDREEEALLRRLEDGAADASSGAASPTPLTPSSAGGLRRTGSFATLAALEADGGT